MFLPGSRLEVTIGGWVGPPLTMEMLIWNLSTALLHIIEVEGSSWKRKRPEFQDTSYAGSVNHVDPWQGSVLVHFNVWWEGLQCNCGLGHIISCCSKCKLRSRRLSTKYYRKRLRSPGLFLASGTVRCPFLLLPSIPCKIMCLFCTPEKVQKTLDKILFRYE